MMYQMTFNQYDKFLELLDDLKMDTFYPSVEEIDFMRKDPLRWVLFACFLLEKGETPQTNADKYGKKNLNQFIQEFLELVETEEEITNPIPLCQALFCTDIKENDEVNEN